MKKVYEKKHAHEEKSECAEMLIEFCNPVQFEAST